MQVDLRKSARDPVTTGLSPFFSSLGLARSRCRRGALSGARSITAETCERHLPGNLTF